MLPPPGRPPRERPLIFPSPQIVDKGPTPSTPIPQVETAPSTPEIEATAPITPAPSLRRRPVRKPPPQDLTPAQRAITPAELAAFQVIETEMGGRGKLVATLATIALSPKIDQVLGMIADPRNDELALGQICAANKVTGSDLLKVFQEATKTRGQMIAFARIAEKLPDVAASVMDDAVPGYRTCVKCKGAGKLDRPTDADPLAKEKCSACDGAGLVYHTPDHEVQKTALKIGGILDSGKGGVNLNILQAQMNANSGKAMGYDDLIGAMDDVLYGKGRDRLVMPALEGELDEEIPE